MRQERRRIAVNDREGVAEEDKDEITQGLQDLTRGRSVNGLHHLSMLVHVTMEATPMRNVWIFVSGIALVIALGGVVYYFIPKQPVDPASLNASAVPQLPGNQVLIVPTGNPLLTANREQLRQWFPAYCGADMFVAKSPKAFKIDICVSGIRERVEEATNVKLTRTDVLDPRVKAHWLELMGAK